MLNLKLYCVALLLAAAVAEEDSAPTLITSGTKTPKVQVTRTSLHVARSLDPEATQTLEVRTRTGDIATLIVKKRDGKSAPLGIPEPVSIRSSSLRVLEEPKSQGGASGDDAIQVVAPPARAEKMIHVPAPTYVRSSSVYVKGDQKQSNNDGFWKRGRSVMHVDSDGIPVITGVRMPDDESDRQTWRNARVINGILVPYDTTTTTPLSATEINTKTTVLQQLDSSSTPVSSQERKKEHGYNHPYSQYTHQRILDYINTVNQRETESRNQMRSIRGRMIHYPEFSRRSEEDNDRNEARVLHYPGTSIYPTSLLYTPQSSKTSRVSVEEGVRTPILQYAHPELGVQPAKVTTKQEEEGRKNENEKDKTNYSGLTLAYFSQDIHSDRSPYAYEPGLEMDEETTEAAASDRRSTTSGNNVNDLQGSLPKNSRAYLYQQQPSDDYGLATDKYIKRYPYNSLYSNSGKDSYNRYKGDPPTGQGYGRYPYGNGYYKVQITREKPFWERIGETIRDHVQNGMDKVSDLTRPVVDPLVEATQKITHNLGLVNGEHNPKLIQDKVGSAVAAYPVLLPALGLVAGGAALGLGAVAVGRYLDIDMLKKRSGEQDDDDDDDSDLEMEHKRALESLIKALMEREDARSAGGDWVVAEEFKDPKVQIKVLENAARSLSMQQKNGVQDQTIESQIKAIEKIVSKLKQSQKKDDNQWVIVEESTQQENNAPLSNSSPSKQKDEADDRWILVQSIAPPQRQRSLEEEAMWVITDDQNEDRNARTLEKIVESLDEHKGRGNWVVAKSNEAVAGDWVMANNRNEDSAKNKRSLDDVILLVEEDPKQPRVARQAELNQALAQSQFYHLLGNYQPYHRIAKRSIGTNVDDRDFLLFDNRRDTGHKVMKRASNSEGAEEYLNNILQSLDSNQQETTARLDTHPQDWSNTPCAKRIFCDVMVKQPADSVLQMEKKMATFLSLIQPNESVSYHLHDVMEAVKRQDCTQFQCHQRAAVDIPLLGPGPR